MRPSTWDARATDAASAVTLRPSEEPADPPTAPLTVPAPGVAGVVLVVEPDPLVLVAEDPGWEVLVVPPVPPPVVVVVEDAGGVVVVELPGSVVVDDPG